jgi:hypothetical protein
LHLCVLEQRVAVNLRGGGANRRRGGADWDRWSGGDCWQIRVEEGGADFELVV